MQPETFMDLAQRYRSLGHMDFADALEALCRQHEERLRIDEVHDFVSETVLGIKPRT
jgi:hypothetical protein